MISTPAIDAKGKVEFFAAPPGQPGMLGAGGDNKRKAISTTFDTSLGPSAPVAKKPKPSPAPASPFSSVGAMAVGQGSCNLLIDGNNLPALYYDTGWPLWFFTSSAPAALRAGAVAPPPVGPIAPQGGRKMEVVLSHWDWDHWRLARVWQSLTGPDIPWLVPVQPVGPSAINFFHNVLGRNCSVVHPNAPRVMDKDNYTVYRAKPGPNMDAAAVMNNTGLALKVAVASLPQPPSPAPQVQLCVALTGDANFASLPAPFPHAVDLFGITAVHHGSNAHGASENLPPPAIPGAGRIAYSYGRLASGRHPYGFPNPTAVERYRAGGWHAPERGTPEDPPLNAGQPPGGNIRFGGTVDLGPPYSNTAFGTFPVAMRLT